MITLYEVSARNSAARVLDLMEGRSGGVVPDRAATVPPPTPPPPHPHPTPPTTERNKSTSKTAYPQQSEHIFRKRSSATPPPNPSPTPPPPRTKAKRRPKHTPSPSPTPSTIASITLKDMFLYQGKHSCRQSYGPKVNPHNMVCDAKGETDRVYEIGKEIAKGKRKTQHIPGEVGSLVEQAYRRRRKVLRKVAGMRQGLVRGLLRRYFCKLECWWLFRDRRHRRHKPDSAYLPKASTLHSTSDCEDLKAWDPPSLSNITIELQEQILLKEAIQISSQRRLGLQMLYEATLTKEEALKQSTRPKIITTSPPPLGVPLRFPHITLMLEYMLGISVGYEIETKKRRAQKSPPRSISPEEVVRSPHQDGVVKKRAMLRKRLGRERGVTPGATPTPPPQRCQASPQGEVFVEKEKKKGEGSPKQGYTRSPTVQAQRYYGRHMLSAAAASKVEASAFLSNLQGFLWKMRVERNVADKTVQIGLQQLRDMMVDKLVRGYFMQWAGKVIPTVHRNRAVLSKLSHINASRQMGLLQRSWRRFHCILGMRLAFRYSSFNTIKHRYRLLYMHMVRGKRVKALKQRCVTRTREMGLGLMKTYYRRFVLLAHYNAERTARQRLEVLLSSEICLADSTTTIPTGPVLEVWGVALAKVSGEMRVGLCLFDIRKSAKLQGMLYYYRALEGFCQRAVEERGQKQQLRDLRKQIVDRNGNSYIARQFRKLKTVVEQTRMQYFLARLALFRRYTRAARRVQAWYRRRLEMRKANMGGITQKLLTSEKEERERAGYCRCHGAPKMVCLAFYTDEGKRRRQKEVGAPVVDIFF